MKSYDEFEKEYWNYYLILENDFLNTDRYVAISKENYSTFSFEYMKLHQLICAEIDVLLKDLCISFDSTFTGDKIDLYFNSLEEKLIYTNPSTKENILFNSDIVYCSEINEKICPWKGWKEGSTPKWWSDHNKTKHSRSLEDKDNNGRLYYMRANLENTLTSLAGLFQVESYYLNKINGNNQVYYNPSKLFTMCNWKEKIISMDQTFSSLIDD